MVITKKLIYKDNIYINIYYFDMDKETFYTSTPSYASEIQKEFLFDDEKISKQLDINNGSYSSGELNFGSLSALTASDTLVNWDQSTLEIPIVMTLAEAATAGFTATSVADEKVNSQLMTQKNSNTIHINSIRLDMNGESIISYQNNTALKCNYELLSSFNSSDAVEMSNSNFAVDTSGSITHSATSNKGVGLLANSTTLNKGLEERLKNINFYAPAHPLTDTSTVNATRKSHINVSDADKVVLFYLCHIPLNQLHDLFRKMPLTKGVEYNLSFQLNTAASCVLTTAPTSSNLTYSSTTQYGTFPYMITDQTSKLKADKKYTMSASIAKNGVYSHPIQKCALNVKTYKLTPSTESAYFKDANRLVRYEDCQIYDTQKSIAPGSYVNTLLNSSINKLRKLVILPFMSATDSLLSGVTTGSKSPFSCEPASCSPFAFISDIEIKLSDKSVYSNRQNYSYEQYQLECVNQNGSRTGLVTQEMFDSGYGMVVVDLSKHSKTEDMAPKSVYVSFKNSAAYTCDYVMLLYFENSIGVNVVTGNVKRSP